MAFGFAVKIYHCWKTLVEISFLICVPIKIWTIVKYDNGQWWQPADFDTLVMQKKLKTYKPFPFHSFCPLSQVLFLLFPEPWCAMFDWFLIHVLKISRGSGKSINIVSWCIIRCFTCFLGTWETKTAFFTHRKPLSWGESGLANWWLCLTKSSFHDACRRHAAHWGATRDPMICITGKCREWRRAVESFWERLKHRISWNFTEFHGVSTLPPGKMVCLLPISDSFIGIAVRLSPGAAQALQDPHSVALTSWRIKRKTPECFAWGIHSACDSWRWFNTSNFLKLDMLPVDWFIRCLWLCWKKHPGKASSGNPKITSVSQRLLQCSHTCTDECMCLKIVTASFAHTRCSCESLSG